jgi:hypothetical protein
MAGIPQVITEDRASGAQFIGGSLKFDSAKSQHLKRTYNSAGNRRFWTWSAWVKRGSIPSSNVAHSLFGSYYNSSSRDVIRIGGEVQDSLSYQNGSAGDYDSSTTSAVLRDIGWYHFVISADLNQGTQTDRVKIYVNGELQSKSNDAQATRDSFLNWEGAHFIGARSTDGSASAFWDGGMSQVYFIDGQALGPEYFGYTDPLTNVWRPKKFEHLSTAITTQYSGASALTWDDNPIGSIYTLSNGNKTATAGEATSSGYTGADVWSNAIPANATTAFTLEITNSDSVGGWYFTDSQTPSGTHPDERGGNSLGMRNQDADAGWFGTFATANGSTSQGHILPLLSCHTWGSKRVDFVVYRPASGNGKVWVKNNGSSTWVGGGDPSNTGSTPSFNIPDGDTYFGYTFYDRSNGDQIATLDGDGSIQQKAGPNSFYLPMDGSAPIGKDQSGRGNDWTPINLTGSVTPDNPTADGALSILKPYKPGGVRTDSKTYTVTASGGNYYLDGALKPTLNVLRGGSYTFDYTGATSHPFYLSSLQDGKHNSKAYSSRLYRSGGYLDLGTGHTDLQPGSGDFCIELYVNLVNQGANFPVFVDSRVSGATDTNGFFWGIRDSDNRIYLYTHSGTQIYADHSLTTGKWYHLALTRQSGTFRMFIDGSQAGVSYSQSQNYTNQIRYIGHSTNSEVQTWYIDAYISNFRFVKGEAVYTTNFTPPQTTLTTTSQGVSSSNVKLLCCQDSSPTTAVVSPGTITLGQAGSDAVTSVNTHNPFLYNSVHGNFGVNTATSNTTKITIPNYAADTLYYYCSAHSGMGSSINVTTDAFKVDPYAWKCVVAAPLDKNLDYSDQINVNSSAKTVASFEGSQAYVSNTNFYRSALDLGAANARNSTSISSSNDYFFGLSPWTVEVWAYRTSNTSNSNYMPLWEITGDSGLGVGWLAFLGAEAGVNRFFYGYGSTHTSVTWGLSPINQWVHNAFVFDGQYLMVFEDGFCKNRTAYSSLSGPPAYFGRPAQMNLGTQNYSGDGNNRNFAGYVQDFRVYKGVAKYTASAVGDHSYTPASTNPDILPDTPSGITGKTNLAKITDGAVAFDGTGSSSDTNYLSIPSSSDFAFGAGDFTIEYFLYLNSTPSVVSVPFDMRPLNTNGAYPQMSVDSTLTLKYYVNTDYRITGTTGGISLNKWVHIALSRSGTSTKMFVDGIQTGNTYSDSINYLQSGVTISSNQYSTSEWGIPGFISNFRVIKGTALYTSNFIPPTRALTNVTNTKLLCCQSMTSATEAAVTPGSITANGNAVATTFNPFTDDINAIRGQATGYATLNPLVLSGGATLSNGNLDILGSTPYRTTPSTIGIKSGKYYWEYSVLNFDGASTDVHLGICLDNFPDFRDTWVLSTNYGWGYTLQGGYGYAGNSQSNIGSSPRITGDIIAFSFDADEGKLYLYVNGVIVNSGNPIYTGLTNGPYYPFVTTGTSAGNISCNFGQKPFKFPPPDGFQSLNLSTVQPEKVIARPDQYVDAITYSGNNTSSNTITDLKFNSKPDFVWIKSRSGSSSPGSQNHYLMDSVRGANGASGTSKLYSNNNGAANSGQTATTNGVRFTHNGFELTTNNDGTNSNNNYVAWCWKAGGSEGTFNVDGATYATAAAAGLSAGTMTVTGASVGTKQGFSIVRYTGSGSAGSLAHGLGQKPTFWIVKAIDAATYPNWYAYTEQLDGSLDFMHFHTNEHKFNSAAAAPTSTTIGITSTLGEAVSWITYMWHDVPGLQKFGSFIGNSSQNFVELGFRPAIVWVKRAIANSSADTSTNNSAWTIMDSTRLSYNGQTPNHLYANHTADEGKRGTGTGTTGLADMTLEPHSNGFYLNGPATETNSNTGKFIYCAWAEAPSINLYGAQSNAR